MTTALRPTRTRLAVGVVAALAIAYALLAFPSTRRAGADVASWTDVSATPVPPATCVTTCLADGFASVGSNTGSYEVGFGIDGENDVRLRGLSMATDAATFDIGGQYGVPIFTLPCGDRPAANVHIGYSFGDPAAALHPAVMTILSDGTVLLQVDEDSPAITTVGSDEVFSGFVSLDAIRFENDGDPMAC